VGAAASRVPGPSQGRRRLQAHRVVGAAGRRAAAPGRGRVRHALRLGVRRRGHGLGESDDHPLAP
jgi:hypothetical protein